MRYAAAYLLAILGGNPSPTVADIGKILGSVGIECDEKRAQKVIDASQGRNIDDIIADGMNKIDNLAVCDSSAIILPPGRVPSKDPTTPKLDPINVVPPSSPSPPASPSGDGLFDLFA